MKQRTVLGLLGAATLAAALTVTLAQSQGGHPAPASVSNPHNIGVMEACNNITYFHCETNRCASGVFYLNYDPTADHFSSPYGSALYQGEQGNIRDEQPPNNYRRYGPRGVRAAHEGKYGFYSTACFP